MNEQLNIWNGRFCVSARARQAFGREDVWFTLVREDMEEDEMEEILKPIGLSMADESYEFWLSSLVLETFSYEEAQGLSEFLLNCGFGVGILPANVPEPGFGSVADLGVGGNREDVLLFYLMDGYDLPFKAVGYFDLDGLQQIPGVSVRDEPLNMYRWINKMQFASEQ